MKKEYKKPEITVENLFANISHDLRASVSVIAGAAEVIASETEPGSAAGEMAALILRRTAFLQRFLEDMRLLSGLECNEYEHEMKEVDVRLFLEDYYYSLLAGNMQGGREIVLDIPEDFRASALMDPDLTVRVMDNLVSNAVKYSGEDARIIIGASDNGEGDEVTVSVSDNGIGIAPEDLPHIFERSFRAKKERPPEDLSSGLGLAIARRIIENSGGKIECESTAGRGSTFRFTLKKLT